MVLSTARSTSEGLAGKKHFCLFFWHGVHAFHSRCISTYCFLKKRAFAQVGLCNTRGNALWPSCWFSDSVWVIVSEVVRVNWGLNVICGGAGSVEARSRPPPLPTLWRVPRLSAARYFCRRGANNRQRYWRLCCNLWFTVAAAAAAVLRYYVI